MVRVKYASGDHGKIYCYEGEKRVGTYSFDGSTLEPLRGFFLRENIDFSGWARLGNFWSSDYAVARCPDGDLLFDSFSVSDRNQKLFLDRAQLWAACSAPKEQ